MLLFRTRNYNLFNYCCISLPTLGTCNFRTTFFVLILYGKARHAQNTCSIKRELCRILRIRHVVHLRVSTISAGWVANRAVARGGGTISEQASEWLVDCNSLNGCSKNTDKPLKSQWSPLADSAVCVGNKTERERDEEATKPSRDREGEKREREGTGKRHGMGRSRGPNWLIK